MIGNAKKKDLQTAAYDPKAAGLLVIGHGLISSGRHPLGTLSTHYDKVNKQIKPSDIDRSKVSKNLKFVILAACKVDLKLKRVNGRYKEVRVGWQQRFGVRNYATWDIDVDTQQIRDFLQTDEELNELIDRKLHHGGTTKLEFKDFILGLNRKPTSVRILPILDTVKTCDAAHIGICLP